jgi:hypothetical protein
LISAYSQSGEFQVTFQPSLTRRDQSRVSSADLFESIFLNDLSRSPPAEHIPIRSHLSKLNPIDVLIILATLPIGIAGSAIPR